MGGHGLSLAVIALGFSLMAIHCIYNHIKIDNQPEDMHAKDESLKREIQRHIEANEHDCL